MLYPIGIQNFGKIREGGYVYVDKTDLIYNIVQTGGYYFLSRPRRFGKSLLVSTLEAYFQGKKELFQGLAIENLEKDWSAYPVLHLDLSGKEYNTMDDLDVRLDRHLSQWENSFGFEKRYPMADARFSDIIDAAYEKTGKPVVILIDEYDKPLLDTAGNEPLREAFRSRLQGFYSVMKSQDGKLRFGFLTGVTKLGKLSIFSGLNNLNDISMMLCQAQGLLRRLSFLRGIRRHLQSLQPTQRPQRAKVPRLLVRDRHADLRGQGIEDW